MIEGLVQSFSVESEEFNDFLPLIQPSQSGVPLKVVQRVMAEVIEPNFYNPIQFSLVTDSQSGLEAVKNLMILKHCRDLDPFKYNKFEGFKKSLLGSEIDWESYISEFPAEAIDTVIFLFHLIAEQDQARADGLVKKFLENVFPLLE